MTSMKNFLFSNPCIYDDSDSITGLVLKDDYLLKFVEDEHTKPLKEIKRNIIIVHAFTNT